MSVSVDVPSFSSVSRCLHCNFLLISILPLNTHSVSEGKIKVISCQSQKHWVNFKPVTFFCIDCFSSQVNKWTTSLDYWSGQKLLPHWDTHFRATRVNTGASVMLPQSTHASFKMVIERQIKHSVSSRRAEGHKEELTAFITNSIMNVVNRVIVPQVRK